MPVLRSGLATAIRQLPEVEKDKLLLRFARANADMHDVLAYELLEDVTLQSLQDETEAAIDAMLLHQRVRSPYKALSRSLTKAQKAIARVKKITKEPKLEIDLLFYLLNRVLDQSADLLKGPYGSLTVKTGRLALRLHEQLHKNLHPDYLADYKPAFDELMARLREHLPPRHLTFTLPTELVV